MNRSFNFRTLISLLLGWSFLCLLVSGIVLYISPPGRIANWDGWTMGWLHKEQWQAIHVVVALTFLIGGAFHFLKFNWRPFKNYLLLGGAKARRFHRELAVSLGLFIILLVGAAANYKPVSYIMKGSEMAKEYWETKQPASPVPHMELLTVQQVSRQLNTEPERVIKSLESAGAKNAASNETLKQVAAKSNKTPRQLYNSLRSQLAPEPNATQPALGQGARPQDGREIAATEGHEPGAGAGWGRKTIEQVAAEIGLDSATVLQRLHKQGVNARVDENLRDVAQRNNLRPYELAEMIRGKQ